MTGESSVEEIGEAGFFVLNGIFYSPFQNEFGNGSGYVAFRLRLRELHLLFSQSEIGNERTLPPNVRM